MKESAFIALSPLERFAIFLLVFFPDGEEVDDFLHIFERVVKNTSYSGVERLYKGLERKSIVAGDGYSGGELRIAVTLNIDQIASLAASATKHGWWPGEQDFISYHKGAQKLELLRILLCEPERDVSVDGRDRNIFREVAFYAHRILGGANSLRYASDAVASNALCSIMPYWLNISFICGRWVASEMQCIHNRLKGGGKISDLLMQVYCSMAVWRADPEMLSPLDCAKVKCAAAADAALKGNFAAADKLLDSSEIMFYQSRSAAAAFDNFPVRLFRAMVFIAARPEKINKTKLTEFFRVPRTSYSYDAYASEYEYLVEEVCRHFSSKWVKAMAGKGQALEDYVSKRSVADNNVGILVNAWDYKCLKIARVKFRDCAEEISREALRWAGSGYWSFSDMLISLVHGAANVDAAIILEKEHETRQLHSFFPKKEEVPEWKNALEVMGKSLKKLEASVVKENPIIEGRLFWRVDISENSDKQIRVLDIGPCLCATGDFSGLYEQLDIRDCLDYSRLMSSKDFVLLDRLREIRCYYYNDIHSALPRLVGMDNLFVRLIKSGRPKESPLTVVSKKMEMQTAVCEDGGVELQLQKFPFEEIGRYGFVAEAPRWGEIEILNINKFEKEIISLFSDYGSGGVLKFPKESRATLDSILERMGVGVSIREKEAPADVSLPCVKGEADLIVRLNFDDGILSVQSAIRPIRENPNLILEPCTGAKRKIVEGVSGAFVLERDMDAESAAVKRVADSLNGMPLNMVGSGRWRFEKTEDALDALLALKSAEPPLALEWIKGRSLAVSSTSKSSIFLRSERTAEDWFRVEGDFKLSDGRVLSMMKIVEAAASNTGKYIRLSEGDYLMLTDSLRRQIDALAAAGVSRGGGLEFSKAAVPMLDSEFGKDEDSLELPEAMRPAASEIKEVFKRDVIPPTDLKAELRPYQREGFRWLSRLAACGLGACLADDMGLGKTLQIISLLLERAEDEASLVIAPSSVCGNWRREIIRFAPGLNPLLPQEDPLVVERAGKGDVVIASYNYILFHAEDFSKRSWNGLVLDEAQAIKNDASKRAKTVKRIKARFKVAATGTPVENRLGELWSLFDFLNPGLLGSAAAFIQRFTDNARASDRLKKLVKPLILRRLKENVLKELPEKTEITLPIELGTLERTAYEACRRRALEFLAQKGEADQKNRMSILAELTRLRRFCCHPKLVLGTNEVPSAKMEALVKLLEELKLAGHRALVFSQFTDFLAIVRKTIDAHGWTHCYLDGSTPMLEREKLVAGFQAGEGDFFVISLKAGGTGLNLTAADYVILLDPWWNPAVENQAADRAHRIGQKRPVTVYRLIAADTVEERVLALHKEKMEIAEDVLDGTSSASLSPAQLLALFK